MASPKKYSMRPAKRHPDGSPVMVKFNNGRSAIAQQESLQVTPDLHRAYMAGDLEIDGYPHDRPGQKKTQKKKAQKKRARKIKASEPEAKDTEAI